MDNREKELFEKIRSVISEEPTAREGWKKLSATGLSAEMEKNRGAVRVLGQKKEFLITFFQNKFGTYQSRKKTHSSQNDVLNAIQFIKKEEKRPFVFNTAWGVLAKKPKQEDYLNAIEHIEILQEYYRKLLEKQKEYICINQSVERIITEYSQYAEAINEKIRTIQSGKTIFPKSWIEDTEIYIGDILEPFSTSMSPLTSRMLRMLDEKGMLDEQKEWFKLPFTYSYKKPFVLFVDYTYTAERVEKHDSRLVPSDLIHSILYQVMDSMPAYTYMFEYFDPIGAGKDLNRLQELNSIINGNAFWLQEDIFHNTFRLLKQAGNQGIMQTMLEDLCEYISKVNQVRCGESILSYNNRKIHEDGSFTDEAEIIPQRFVVFEDIHGVLEQKTASQINTLIENARDCGISIVIVAKHEKRDPLSEHEKRLLEKQIVDVLEWHSEAEADWYNLSVCGAALNKEEDSKYRFNFLPYGEKEAYIAFLEKVQDQYKTNLKVETRLEKIINIEKTWGSKDGAEQIEVPVGVNEHGKISTVTLGGPAGAHALLAGKTGCGKSSLLHTIINGVILNYRPDDVQIWLSDYKANEFQRYMEHTPPHVRYVATDRSMEYSLHFLDRIYMEYQKRIDLFGSITSVKEYREVHGRDSMPRILVIIDEFHVMSDHVREELAYKNKLTKILREARSVGITLLLADQTCGVGLQGLSEAGKNQLTCRMAMKTEAEEYNAVFDITNAREILPEMQPFELLLKRVKEVKGGNGKQERMTFYEHNKTIFIDVPIRDMITEKSIALYGKAIEPEFFKNVKRNRLDWNQIILEEAKNPVRRNKVSLYVGTPADLNKFMQISLLPNYSENLMCIGENMTLQIDVLFHVLASIRKGRESYRILIMAGEYDSLFIECEERLKRLAKEDKNVQVISDESELCREIDKLEKELETRWKQRNPEFGIYLFWIGLDDISKDLKHYKSKSLEKSRKEMNQKRKSLWEDQELLDAKFAALFNEDELVPESENLKSEEEECISVYNANENITHLIKDGPKKSIHHFVFLLSVRAIKQTVCISRIYDTEFKHKIAFRMGKDDAGDYLGRGNLILTMDGELLDEESAVYYDGMVTRRFFPFISDEVK